MEPATDAELVRALGVAHERERAWRELVRRHTGRLYAVARSFAIDEQTAADLVQTAWLRLVERSHQLRDPDSVGAWLAMIVRNEARRLVTRQRTTPTADGWERMVDLGPAPDNRLLTDERGLALRSAFAQLNDGCRQLLRLLTADPPLSYAVIAQTVGRPIGSLGPSRQRCLEQLRKLLPPGVTP